MNFVGSSSSSSSSGELGSFGVFSALRTGHAATDLALALTIPMVLSFFTNIMSHVAEFLFEVLMSMFFSKAPTSYSERSVECETVITQHGVDNAEQNQGGAAQSRNQLLQKAIMLRIGSLGFNFQKRLAMTNLVAVKESFGFDEYQYARTYGEDVDSLRSYEVINSPVENEWTPVRNTPVEVYISRSVESISPASKRGASSITDSQSQDGGGVQYNVLKTTIKIRGLEGKLVDDFIQDSFTAFVKRMESIQDRGRFLFSLVKGGDAPRYSRHRLSEEKSFDSFFSPFKPELLSLLEDFQECKGKYKIKGVQRKLGFLLTGPPGTGKTSMIKALAQKLKRHIVSIPLSRLKTNQELASMFFGLSFPTVQELGESSEDRGRRRFGASSSLPENFSYDDLVFVIEDVDATSPAVVGRRAKPAGPKTGLDGPPLLRTVSSSTAARLEEVKKQDETVVQELLKAEMLKKVSSSSAEAGASAGGNDLASMLAKLQDDPINLAGLLNVLDGVVDTPGRIVVLTSNHPELLDPALIRPGRVDRIYLLDYVVSRQAVEMAKHFFAGDKDIENVILLDRLAESFASDRPKRTPAEIEQLAVSKDSFRAFVEAAECDDWVYAASVAGINQAAAAAARG